LAPVHLPHRVGVAARRRHVHRFSLKSRRSSTGLTWWMISPHPAVPARATGDDKQMAGHGLGRINAGGLRFLAFPSAGETRATAVTPTRISTVEVAIRRRVFLRLLPSRNEGVRAPPCAPPRSGSRRARSSCRMGPGNHRAQDLPVLRRHRLLSIPRHPQPTSSCAQPGVRSALLDALLLLDLVSQAILLPHPLHRLALAARQLLDRTQGSASRSLRIGFDGGPLLLPVHRQTRSPRRGVPVGGCAYMAAPPRSSARLQVSAAAHATRWSTIGPRTMKPASQCGLQGTATGIRTRVSGLRIRRPSPLDDSGAGARF
jgi:hypothetical protein